VEGPDRQVGDRADQRVRRSTDPAGQHHRIGGAVESPCPVEQVHHAQRVRHDGEPRHVEQALGQRERGCPRGQRDRRTRPDQAGRRAGDRGLLRPLEHQLGLEAGIVAGGRPRQDRPPVHFLYQAILGEHLKVSADRHIRNAEPLSEIADACAAIAPDGLQDERLAVSGKHPLLPPCRAEGAGGRAGGTGASSVLCETFAIGVRFRVRLCDADGIPSPKPPDTRLTPCHPRCPPHVPPLHARPPHARPPIAARHTACMSLPGVSDYRKATFTSNGSL
jgi:hypothetical protein